MKRLWVKLVGEGDYLSVACIYLGCMTAPACLYCVGAAASPMVRASTASYSGFFEPVMRIRLIVEGLDFKIAALAIQRLRFFESSIGFEPERAHSKISRTRFQRFEDAPTDAEAARIGGDPHAFDFADRSIFHFEGAATDRLTTDAGDDEDAGGWAQFIGVCGDGLCRVEAGFEAAGQLAEILSDAPMRIGAARRFRRYLNGGCAHQPLDLRHRRDQAIPLRDAERGQNGFGQRVGTTIKLSQLAQPGAGQPHPADAAVVRRRVRLHQPLPLERAHQAADVTGIQPQSRA